MMLRGGRNRCTHNVPGLRDRLGKKYGLSAIADVDEAGKMTIDPHGLVFI